MGKTTKFFVSAILISLFSLILTARSDTIVFIDSTEPEHLNPGGQPNHFSYEVISNICEGLVRFKKNTSEIAPCLAVKWTSTEAGMKWIFHLRKGVKFHNGADFTSESVVHTFTRRFFSSKVKNDFWKIYFSSIKGIRALGPYKLEITLRKKFVPFLMTLAHPMAFISLPPKSSEEQLVPLGTGPFKFSQWTPGKHIIIRKFDQYWGFLPKIKKVVYKYIEENPRRIRFLRNGKADIISVRSGSEREQLRGIKNIKIKTYPISSTHFLMLNTKKPPLNNILVRRAIAHLINKNNIIKYIFQDYAKNAVTHIPPNIRGFNHKIRDYEYNPGKAEKLLIKSGFNRTLKFSIYYMSGVPAFHRIANIICNSAEQIGVKIDKFPLPFNEMLKAYAKGEHDLGIMGWAGDYPDPDGFLTQILSMQAGNINYSFYSNSSLTEILNLARTTIDIGKREMLYFQAQEIIHKDIPSIPLFHMMKYLAMNNNISGTWLNQSTLTSFRDAEIKN